MGWLSRKESGWLYVVVFSSSLFFFIVGLLVGRGYLGQDNEIRQGDLAETGRFVPQEPQSDVAELGKSGEDSGKGPSEADASGADAVEVRAPEARELPRETPEVLIDSRKLVPGRSPEGVESSEPGKPRLFTVQVGAFRSRDEADQVSVRLSARGYPSIIVSPDSANTFYRICVGQSALRAGVSELESQLRRDGFSTYVRQMNAELLNQ